MSGNPGNIAKAASPADPLTDPKLKGPGLRRLFQELLGKRRLLDVAQIEVSSACPGQCAYCPHSTMKDVWKTRHMAPATFAALWPLLLETRRVHLQGWGEPFLNPRFLDMVALARRADCLVSTTSCGLFMTEEFAAGLVASGLDIVAFSLTGATRHSNNAARRGVDFDRVLESVRSLQKVRQEKMGVHLEVHFAYLMLAGAVDEVRLLPELMDELNVHAAVVSTLDYIPESGWEQEAFAPHETEKIAAARTQLALAAARAKDLGRNIYYSLPAQQPRPFCLENPARSIYVDAEGNLAPCIYVNLPTTAPDPMRRVFGNALDENPLSLWQGKDFSDFCAALASGDPQAPCRNCPKRYAVGNRNE